MRFYRKKPVVIDAERVPISGDESYTEYVNRLFFLAQWCNGSIRVNREEPNGILIPTLEGTMLAGEGDYIIKGVQGEFYPCKPDIFAATYEEVDENWVAKLDRMDG